MAIHKIVYLPDVILRSKNQPIIQFDEKLHELIDDMFATMYEVKGVGLAAPQIGKNLQLSVIDVSAEKTQKLVLVNPKILKLEGQKEYDEGCLSVPGVYDKVVRADKVTIEAQDMYGKVFQLTADGLLGQCLQHEIDHLHAKLFVDLLSSLKRTMANQRMKKFKRQKNIKD